VKRRTFIAGLGGAATWPVVARAQQAAVPVIGVLSLRSADMSKSFTVPFLQGLKETGYVEGQNVAMGPRGAAAHEPNRLTERLTDRRHQASLSRPSLTHPPR
jgi:putative ABC transport system substrate-binding protein